MITGGDAKIRLPPQFGFSFRPKAEAFSVRLITWLEAVPLCRLFFARRRFDSHRQHYAFNSRLQMTG
jgi:hypothetical protein